MEKKPRCKGRKKEQVCISDNKCDWNGTSCDMRNYDKYINICKTRKGKEALINFAKKMNIEVKSQSIPELCKLIDTNLENAKSESKKDLYDLFDSLINERRSVAPIITKKELTVLKRRSSTLSIKTLFEFPMNDRNRFYKHVVAALSKKSDKDIYEAVNSKVINLYKRIGSESGNGEVWLTTLKYRKSDMIIATKLMPIIPENSNEILQYKFFNNYVLKNKNPHYPLIYRHIVSKHCPYEMKEYININLCYMVFNELANGDLKTWILASYYYKQFVSMICQIVMGGFTLEENKLIHNDFHWGNVLYHNVPLLNNKYTHYKVNNKNIYVLNTGQHWILWDFSDVSKQNPNLDYVNSVSVDMYRIASISQWYEHSKVPTKKFATMRVNEVKICKSIKTYCQYGGVTYMELLEYINSLLLEIDPEQKMLLIDPIDPPKEEALINKIPYIIRK